MFMYMPTYLCKCIDVPMCYVSITAPNHHDSVGMFTVYGRDLHEAHLFCCMYAGVNISGGNAEVCQGQVRNVTCMSKFCMSKFCMSRFCMSKFCMSRFCLKEKVSSVKGRCQVFLKVN